MKLGDREFPVSRLALASASPFFRAAFSGSMLESGGTVTLDPSLSPSCVEALLRFAHGSLEVRIAEPDLEEFVTAADQLSFTDVLPLVTPLLASSLSADNCTTRLVLCLTRIGATPPTY